MPVRALRLDNHLNRSIINKLSESSNARQGIKTPREGSWRVFPAPSESSNARQGIKTQGLVPHYTDARAGSESSNARQGIKTFLLLGKSKNGKGPNHRMPVRALRQNSRKYRISSTAGPNHRMPVRALRRPSNPQYKLSKSITSESSNARQGIKTYLPAITPVPMLGPNHRMPVRALRRYQ